VKCSASCRCVGCKNVGSAATNEYIDYNINHGMGMMSAAAAQAAHQAAMHYHRLPPPLPRAMMNPAQQHNASPMRQYGMINSGRPPRQPHIPQPSAPVLHNWNDPLSAAQSLTFLKRGSPSKPSETDNANQPNRMYSMNMSPITKSPGTSGVVENASVPSLASSSEGDSPGVAGLGNHLTAMSTPESFRGESNALLLAAVAMTEFGQSPPPSSSMLSPDTIRTYNEDYEEENDDEDDDDAKIPATPGDIVDVNSTLTTPQQRRTSKRSINFDDMQNGNTNDSKKKSKSIH
jgi:hypothetical protein